MGGGGGVWGSSEITSSGKLQERGRHPPQCSLRVHDSGSRLHYEGGSGPGPGSLALGGSFRVNGEVTAE